MKPLTSTLCFLLFVFIIDLPLAFSQIGEPVLDKHGNPLIPDSVYYILPPTFGQSVDTNGPSGGGVDLAKPAGSSCPVTVLQLYSEVNKGLPVKIKMTRNSYDAISVNTPLDIEFEWQPECAISSKWVVVVEELNWVGIGDGESRFENRPDKILLSGKFKIQKYEKDYKLVFCPSNTGVCYDLGGDNVENGRRLILTKNKPFKVVFVKAGSKEMSIV